MVTCFVSVIFLFFGSVAPLGYSYKALPQPFFCSLLLFSPLPVSHFHAPFQGSKGGKRQINKVSFQSLYSQRGLSVEAAGEGGVGGLRPAIENCCPYPERSVYTTCKVKQIDPGCRFTCVFARLPVNLPACHLQSMFFTTDQTPLSLFAFLCLCEMLCVCFPYGCQAWIQRNT